LERLEATAYLQSKDKEMRRKLAEMIDNKDPANWISLEEA